MDYYSMTDRAIMVELGKRIRAHRLRNNLTQEELAKRAMLSASTIKSLEKGNAKLSTIIAVLRELSNLEGLDAFIPEQTVSPLQLAKMSGKKRQRASRDHRAKKTGSESSSEW